MSTESENTLSGAPVGLTIGQLAEATGMTPGQLRTWETRHGFPVAVRARSGHRRYHPDTVTVVLRVLADRAAGYRLDQAIERQTAADFEPVDSIYAALRDRHPDLVAHRVRKRSLTRLCAAIEDEARSRSRRPLVVAAFQRVRHYEAVEARWSELARIAQLAFVMADFGEHDETSVPRRVALPPASPLLSEWVLAVESDALCAVVVAWEAAGQGGAQHADTVYEASWTTDPYIVREALAMAASAAVGVGAAAGERLQEVLAARPAPRALDPIATSAVLSRVLAYLDAAR